MLAGKVALVTGAGKGIGRACAQALAARGVRVALVSRTEAELLEVAQALDPDQVLVQTADISQESAVRRVFDSIEQRWGTLDILVNNAAIFHKAPVVDQSLASWSDVLAVNLTGPFLCSREVFRQVVQAPKPVSIINIGSLSGVRGTEKFPGLSSYVVSKFGITGLTEALAVEGRPLGIRVNCVAPGAVATEMLKKAAPHLKTQTTPEQIAKTIIYLADEEQSSHVSGAVIEVFSNLPTASTKQ